MPGVKRLRPVHSGRIQRLHRQSSILPQSSSKSRFLFFQSISGSVYVSTRLGILFGQACVNCIDWSFPGRFPEGKPQCESCVSKIFTRTLFVEHGGAVRSASHGRPRKFLRSPVTLFPRTLTYVRALYVEHVPMDDATREAAVGGSGCSSLHGQDLFGRRYRERAHLETPCFTAASKAVRSACSRSSMPEREEQKNLTSRFGAAGPCLGYKRKQQQPRRVGK